MLAALLLAPLLQDPVADTPWADVISKRAPAVVSVRSRVRIAVGRDEVGPFEGSGFVVDAERGIVATNRHVAGEGVVLDLELRFFDGTSVPARRIYADPLHDFAFLRFEPKAAPSGVTAIPLDPREPEVGEDVLMIGNNGGLAATVLSGTVANLDAPWDQDPTAVYFQTSIASSGGSSGSPVIDVDGAAIGIQAAHDEHTSYALPADYLFEALRSLKTGSAPPRGTLGLRLRPVDLADAVAAGAFTHEQAEKLKADAADGAMPFALVEGVVPDSPMAGLLMPGDVVIGVGAIPGGEQRLIEKRLDRAVGESVEVKYARAGTLAAASAKVADMLRDGVDRLVLFAGAAFQDIGFEVRSRTDLRRQGALIAYVAPGSAAEAADLRRDDLVLLAGGKPVADPAALWSIVAGAKDGERIVLVVRRPSSFDSATRAVTLVVDRVWDSSRFLMRSENGWSDAPAASAPAKER